MVPSLARYFLINYQPQSLCKINVRMVSQKNGVAGYLQHLRRLKRNATLSSDGHKFRFGKSPWFFASAYSFG